MDVFRPAWLGLALRTGEGLLGDIDRGQGGVLLGIDPHVPAIIFRNTQADLVAGGIDDGIQLAIADDEALLGNVRYIGQDDCRLIERCGVWDFRGPRGTESQNQRHKRHCDSFRDAVGFGLEGTHRSGSGGYMQAVSGGKSQSREQTPANRA